MTNGDQLTGKVERINEERLAINTSYGGIIAIDLDQVQSIEPDAEFDFDLLADTGRNVDVSVMSDEGAVRLEVSAETIQAALLNPPAPEKRNWDSKVDFSSTINRGNTDSQLINLQGDYSIQIDKNRYIVEVKSVREEKDSDVVKEQDRLRFGYNRLFGEKWFFALDATTERDPVALLDHRISITPSVGYEIFRDETRNLKVQFGVGYAAEKSDGVDESSTMADWRLDYTHLFLDGRMEFFHSDNLYRNFSGRTNLVFKSKTGVRYKITDDIYLNTQLDYDYDTEPAAGKEKDDLAFMVGAGMKF
jgi:putative salt-induced outer membrane protein YdiY